MKLKDLIIRLKRVEKEMKKEGIIDPDVIVDGDENGWYELEDVNEFESELLGETFVNLVSNNEI